MFDFCPVFICSHKQWQEMQRHLYVSSSHPKTWINIRSKLVKNIFHLCNLLMAAVYYHMWFYTRFVYLHMWFVRRSFIFTWFYISHWYMWFDIIPFFICLHKIRFSHVIFSQFIFHVILHSSFSFSYNFTQFLIYYFHVLHDSFIAVWF